MALYCVRDSDNLPKKCIQTINVAKTATDRQNEGAMLINMAFANAPVAVAA